MENITAEILEKKFKGEGAERFSKIAVLGGFGLVGTEQNALDPGSNLDLAGVLDPENKALTTAAKTQLRELAGISDKSAKTETAEPKTT